MGKPKSQDARTTLPRCISFKEAIQSIVMFQHSKGVESAEIERKLKISSAFVRDTIREFQTGEIVFKVPRSARKLSVSPKMIQTRSQLLAGEFKTVTEMIAALVSHRFPEVSESTMNRTCKRMGLRLSDKHKMARLDFCKFYHNCSNVNWDNVLFTNETNISVYENIDGKCWWGFEGEEPPAWTISRTAKSPPQKIMIWLGMSSRGPSSVFYADGIMHSVQYQQVLENNLLAFISQYSFREDFTFHQDNDPCHKSVRINNSKNDHVITPMAWPANSPDLNPIENGWVALKRAIHTDDEMMTVADIRQRIEENYQKVFTPEYCKEWISSMPRRIQQCIDNNGDSTDY